MVDKEIVGLVPKSVKNFRKANRIFNIILCIIIFPIIIVNIIMFSQSLIYKDKVPSFLGYKFFVVLTGSMEDTLKIGDLIVTKKVDSNNLQVSDIITFKEKNTVITHRITNIEKENGGIIFTTKGDNNNTEDSVKVSIENIEGKYIFKISAIGKVLSFIQSIWGIILLIMIPVISMLLSHRKEERANMKRAIRKTKRIEYTQKNNM